MGLGELPKSNFQRELRLGLLAWASVRSFGVANDADAHAAEGRDDAAATKRGRNSGKPCGILSPMRTAMCFLLLWLSASSSAAQVTSPPRDSAGPGRTATVRGQVVNSATTMPLHRVKLTLNGDAANAPVAVTDTRGEFEFIDVPPGTYTISAVRAGYLPTQYGQRRLREAGRPIDVQAGGVVEGVQNRNVSRRRARGPRQR